MAVSEREIRREMLEHPWASREIAMRIIADHKRRKTTIPESRRIYFRDYMRLRRNSKLAVPDLSKALGLSPQKQRRRKK